VEVIRWIVGASRRASGTRAGAEGDLAEEDVPELDTADRDLLGGEEAVYQVEQVVAVAALEQALELVGKGFLKLTPGWWLRRRQRRSTDG
jgi:hypothetical protein